MERETEESFFVAGGPHPVSNVQERAHAGGRWRIFEDRYLAFLLNDDDSVRFVGRVGEQDCVVAERAEVEAGEGGRD